MGIQRRVTTMTMKLVAGLLVLSAFTKGDTNLPDTEELINSNEIFDVIENVIAKEDPMLQLFLRICFLHPNCYQLDIPQKRDGTKSDTVNALEKVLKKKKTETARGLLLSLIDESFYRLLLLDLDLLLRRRLDLDLDRLESDLDLRLGLLDRDRELLLRLFRDLLLDLRVFLLDLDLDLDFLFLRDLLRDLDLDRRAERLPLDLDLDFRLVLLLLFFKGLGLALLGSRFLRTSRSSPSELSESATKAFPALLVEG